MQMWKIDIQIYIHIFTYIGKGEELMTSSRLASEETP